MPFRPHRPAFLRGEKRVSERSKTPLLDQCPTPEDVRKLDVSQLRQLADELARKTIDAVSITGGHLGAGLGGRRAHCRIALSVRHPA